MIKIEHSVFALPFAILGTIWGSQTLPGSPMFPGWRIFTLVLVAMVSCRAAAMAYNRLVDRDIDAKNPRTANRAIPAGLLSSRKVVIATIVCACVFLASAIALNHVTAMLAPVALLITLGYSHAKRFTWLCHLWLGFSLGIAPCAAFLAVTQTLTAAPVLVCAAMTFWTAGFDIIYALHDSEFDCHHGLNSIPARFGRQKALHLSRVFHAVSVALFAGAFVSTHGWLGVVATFFITSVMIYEQSLVKPDDLSKVNLAFFTLNGFVSVGAFVILWIGMLAGFGLQVP
jgi:4-hydroxybenzoate polyprenyltransferase